MISTADVFSAFKSRWDSEANAWVEDGTLLQLVPGGLHQDYIPQTIAGEEVLKPYASLKVTEQAPQYNSTRRYIQVFGCELTIWADRSATFTDPGSLQRILDQVYQRDTAPRQLVFASRDIVVMDLVRQAGNFEQDKEKRAGADVLMLGYHWDLVLQGTR